MNRHVVLVCAAAVALYNTALSTETAGDPLSEAEMQEQEDLERLRAINSGELEFLTAAATARELHTQMVLILSEPSLRDGWVDMRQCQRGLDGMQLTEIVYRYADMRALQVTRSSGIEQAWVENQTVQLRAVQPGAEVCVAAQVNILRDLGDGHYRISSGPYHRRFFDGYFPMRLSLEVRFPEEVLHWRRGTPVPQPGYVLSSEPGRVMIDTRFTGMLRIELDFGQPG